MAKSVLEKEKDNMIIHYSLPYPCSGYHLSYQNLLEDLSFNKAVVSLRIIASCQVIHLFHIHWGLMSAYLSVTKSDQVRETSAGLVG